MSYRLAAILALTSCILALGCGEASPGIGGNSTAGPCVVEHNEPILHINSVTDSSDGEPLSEIEIWDVHRDGTGLEHFPSFYENLSDSADDPDRTICTLPCAFGNTAGTWSFMIGSDGYTEKEVSVDAEYDTHQGGCPALYDDGTSVTFELSPE